METIILSLGGSLIVPDKIDVEYLKKFKSLIENYISKGYRFAIVTGGGKICRDYQKAMSDLIGVNQECEDWLGISITYVNAQLVKGMFEDVFPKVIVNPTEKINFTQKILVGSGWKPGWSTDYVAVLLAKNLGADKIINLTNIDYVYDKDPKDFADAVKFEDISWDKFQKIVGDKWNPGMNLPFDPIASKEAAKSGITVFIINGDDLESVSSVLEGKDFKGTIIH